MNTGVLANVLHTLPTFINRSICGIYLRLLPRTFFDRRQQIRRVLLSLTLHCQQLEGVHSGTEVPVTLLRADFDKIHVDEVVAISVSLAIFIFLLDNIDAQCVAVTRACKAGIPEYPPHIHLRRPGNDASRLASLFGACAERVQKASADALSSSHGECSTAGSRACHGRCPGQIHRLLRALPYSVPFDQESVERDAVHGRPGTGRKLQTNEQAGIIRSLNTPLLQIDGTPPSALRSLR